MFINCPHCNQYIYIESINCGIFRCGIYKYSFEQINPHSSKEICDNLKEHDLIYGCGKPFNYLGEIIDYV